MLHNTQNSLCYIKHKIVYVISNTKCSYQIQNVQSFTNIHKTKKGKCLKQCIKFIEFYDTKEDDTMIKISFCYEVGEAAFNSSNTSFWARSLSSFSCFFRDFKHSVSIS